MTKQSALIMVLGVLCLSALAIAFYSLSAQRQIAFAYNQRIINEFEGTKEGRAILNQNQQTWRANIDTLQLELKQLTSQYEKEGPKLSRMGKQKMEATLQQKQQAFFSYQNAVNQKIKEEQQKIDAAILNQIDSYLLEYGKKSGYDFIFGVTDNGNLLYAGPADDITDKVIDELNRQYKGE